MSPLTLYLIAFLAVFGSWASWQPQFAAAGLVLFGIAAAVQLENVNRRKRNPKQRFQYYYEQTDCTAKSHSSLDCICWFDEGTGPFPNAKQAEGSHLPKLVWAEVPQTIWYELGL